MDRKAASARGGSRSRFLARQAPRIRGESWTPAYDLWTLSRFASGVNRLRRRRRAAVRGVVIAMFMVPLAIEVAAIITGHR